MAQTTRGFWSADKTTPFSIQGITAAAAQGAEAALKASEIRNGIPKAASESALNALFSSTPDAVSGVALAPVVGSMGNINGIPVIWDGSKWWGPGYTWMQIQKTATVTIAATTWQLANAFGTVPTNTGGGSGLTLQTDGILIANAGVYDVAATVRFALSATGYRMVTISKKGGDFGGSAAPWVNANATSGQPTSLSVTRPKLVCAAGDVISVYTFSSVATTASAVLLDVCRVA